MSRLRVCTPCFAAYEEGSQREAAVAKAVRKLPAVHSIALAMLMGHLQRVAAHQAENMVSLNIVIWPRTVVAHSKIFHCCCLQVSSGYAFICQVGPFLFNPGPFIP